MDTEVKVEFIEGNRKNKLAKVKDYLFEKNKNISIGVSYRCVKYKTCPAKLHVLTCGSIQKGDHTHPPSPEKILAREIISQGKSFAKQSLLTTAAEIMDKVENLAVAASLNASYLGPTDNVKRVIRREKLKAYGHASIGETLAEVEVPLSLQVTTRNDRFLLYDNNANESCMLVFASADCLDKLSFCQTWMIDGTFKTCPGLFAQIYTVHGIYRNSIAVPCVYAYLAGKNQSDYAELFRVIRRNVDGEPQYVISDFELAPINAFKDEFFATEMSACLFHLTQNVFKHVKSNNEVYKRYMTADSDGLKVRKAIRSLGGLAFLRPMEVPAAFIELKGLFPLGNPIRSIFTYFEDTYIGYTWDAVRFPISFWNVRERFANQVPRTNNQKEGWHFRFNNLHPKSHPTLQRSIEMVRKEEQHWYLECQKIMSGYIPSRKKKSIQIDRRLREIIISEEAQLFSNKLDFLDAIQRCLHEFLTE